MGVGKGKGRRGWASYSYSEGPHSGILVWRLVKRQERRVAASTGMGGGEGRGPLFGKAEKQEL